VVNEKIKDMVEKINPEKLVQGFGPGKDISLPRAG
jgi:hypothetical protein